MGLRASVELHGGNTELKSTPRILVADPLGLGHHAAGEGQVLGPTDPLLLPDRETRGDQREHQQGGQHGDGAGTATPFALLKGVHALGGGVEERSCLLVELD